jgi:tagaturonate reductase
MIKILQFGEGNFLRAFADAYFQALSDEGRDISVDVVIPLSAPIDRFERQGNKYNVILRGSESGRDVEDVYPISIINSVIDPYKDQERYYALGCDPELKIIVSNTTEAGICYSDSDRFDGFDGITYPAKLTKLLYKRFCAGLDGVYILPVELIDNNAGALYECVDKYISLWSLPEKFREWNNEQNFYCNTLVDRIVSGYPRDPETKAHLTELIGKQDELMSVGEPFGLWAIEKKGSIADYIAEGKHNIEVVLTEDINYYKKRKVRVLNGSHTNLVPAGLWLGAETVYDSVKNPTLSCFLTTTLDTEIVPFVSADVAATQVFADSVLDRFGNPYLNHQLTSIALNSISKWSARNLPSFRDYYAKNGRIAPNMSRGFAYLINLYTRVVKRDGKFFVMLPSREIELVDNAEYLEYFAAGGSVAEFMKNERVWGEDLTAYEGFLQATLENLDRIERGECLI